MKLSAGAQVLLRGMQTSDQRMLDLVTKVQDCLDELIKAGLAVASGPTIRNYSYVHWISLTDAGKNFKEFDV